MKYLNFKNANLLKGVIDQLKKDVTPTLKMAQEYRCQKDEMLLMDYALKIKIEEKEPGNYRIYLKVPTCTKFVDITNDCTDEFQQTLFAFFFRKGA